MACWGRFGGRWGPLGSMALEGSPLEGAPTNPMI